MTRASSTPSSTAPFSGRYDLHEELGRGGMACVYRAVDRTLGRQVALKQLTLDAAAPERANAVALFEREYQTLTQLRHPHVIEVYDYGRLDGSPYYTMELLDGGDLREKAPLAWHATCRIGFDICSALALLHSRRFLHRDISPRNIRCTQTGDAKLIDFGAMVPMSSGGTEVVGTPAFTAPETLQRLALDARTDLYSLGVTLYYALTGRLPYPARSFAELIGAWSRKPIAPSALVPGIPAALDDLVLGLISVEPVLRPRNAFDVMQQLAACADLQVEESEAVARAYLSTPTLIGRDAALSQLRDSLRDSRMRRGAGVLIRGPAGIGRSRLLDAGALEAQAQGFTVLRATASSAREPFAVARALANHLLDALPDEGASAQFPDLFARPNDAPANDTTDAAATSPRPVLRNFSDPELDHGRVQRALLTWWQSMSLRHPLLIAVDEVHRIDPPSAAVLAELIDKTKRGGMLIVLTANSDEPAAEALTALARRCSALPLEALTLGHTRGLLDSLFGDVSNLDMLAGEIHRIALGNPSQTMELAQHLVDRGLIRYASGTWTLPAQLSTQDLPRGAAEAMQTRVSTWSAHARFLAEAQALAFYDSFSDADYRALLPSLSSLEVEDALSELLSAQAVVRDGAMYRLANRMWVAALAPIAARDSEQLHRALVTMYEGKSSIAVVHHAFSAGMVEYGLAAIATRNGSPRTGADLAKAVELNVAKMMWCYPPAIEASIALGHRPREIHTLRRWQFLGCLLHDRIDRESARLWFEQLAHDSGLTLYREDTERADPMQRLTRALQSAQQRYLDTPEPERVYSVEEALRLLGEYVVVSVGFGGGTQDAELLRSLPDVLEPFIALSPLLEVIWLNVLGARYSHCECQYERARALWREALTKLEKLPDTDAHFLKPMAAAIAYAIGVVEAQLGLESAASWADWLDQDPFQRISALQLRKVVRLEQGDAHGAERLRREAEVLSLQLRAPQMFKSLLTVDLFAYARCRDLANVAQVVEQLRALAAQHPGWAANSIYAEGSFESVRGNYEAAKPKFEACIELTRPDARGASSNLGMWLAGNAGLAECLFGLGHFQDARAIASVGLAFAEARKITHFGFEFTRILALAEAKLGDTRAADRVEALLEHQRQLGTTGLRLGLSYEARTQIAIWTGDAASFERYAELTAREYRHGANTPLGVRYDRLMNEAARSGMQAQVSLADFAALTGGDTSAVQRDELLTMVTRSLAGHRSAAERKQLALQMICAAHGAAAGAGHLYLLTPAGPVLCASHGASEPGTELTAAVTSFITAEQNRADEMDDMVTGELLNDEAASAVHAADIDYELLPLSCVIDTRSVLVGVAVISAAADRTRNAQQTQLLNVLATSLIESGDARSLRTTASQD